MKICLINNLYYPYERGGAEKVVMASVKKYQEAGHDVFVITSRPNKTKKELERVYYIPSNYSQLHQYSYLKRFFWHLNNLFSLKIPKKIINIIKQEKPDLIITHNLMGLGFQTPRLIASLNIPHHHFLHDIQLLHPSGLMYYQKENLLDSLPSRIYQSITKELFSSIQKVYSPSQWLLNEHVKRNFFLQTKLEIQTLDNYIDIPKLEKDEKKKQLIFIGQIEKHKGIDVLISAFNKLEDSNLNLLIIGQGSRLKQLQEENKNQKRIKFLGWKTEKEFIPILNSSLALIIPSLCYENSPTIIQYAHQLNVPVIASRIGGIPEALNNNDLTFTPNNSQDLKDKIKELLS